MTNKILPVQKAIEKAVSADPYADLTRLSVSYNALFAVSDFTMYNIAELQKKALAFKKTYWYLLRREFLDFFFDDPAERAIVKHHLEHMVAALTAAPYRSETKSVEKVLDMILHLADNFKTILLCKHHHARAMLRFELDLKLAFPSAKVEVTDGVVRVDGKVAFDADEF